MKERLDLLRKAKQKAREAVRRDRKIEQWKVEKIQEGA
jgi:hypothetical protein